MKPILVIGDLMLDEYVFGDVCRVSPECPVPVLQATSTEYRAGGAAGVAVLASQLGAEVTLVGCIGDDDPGGRLLHILARYGINTRFVDRQKEFKTTVKQRFAGSSERKYPHQVLRVDYEQLLPSPQASACNFLTDDFGVILISDYGKGLLTEDFLQRIFRTVAQLDIPTLVDPARGREYYWYHGCTVYLPNRKEFEAAIDHKITSIEDAKAEANIRNFPNQVIKLDKDGMLVCVGTQAAVHLPTVAKEVCDVTGAGDMVLAAIGVKLSEGAELLDAAKFANVAAGLEVSRFGSTPIERMEVDIAMHTCEGRKVFSLDTLRELVEFHKSKNRKIVFTNGCFDMGLTSAHVRYLEQAKSFGDILIVAINSDASVRRIKGAGRPIMPCDERVAVVSGLECVDYITEFDMDTPLGAIKALMPDLVVKGGDKDPTTVPGYGLVEVRVTDYFSGMSTTEKIDRVKSL